MQPGGEENHIQRDGISALDSIATGAISSGMQAFAATSAIMKIKAFDRALEDIYLIQTKVASSVPSV